MKFYLILLFFIKSFKVNVNMVKVNIIIWNFMSLNLNDFYEVIFSLNLKNKIVYLINCYF
jgi:hypothetical protein